MLHIQIKVFLVTLLLPCLSFGITQITSGGNDLLGSWSPDGSMLAYSFHGPYYTDHWYMLKVNSNGGIPVLLYYCPFADVKNPDWSPDGTKIVFSRGVGQYWLFDSSGGYLYTIAANGASSPVALAAASGVFPRWSPDGTKIAVSDNNYDTGTDCIYTYSANGFNKQLVAEVGGYDLTYPSWSPDGSKIAFQQGYTNNTAIWTVDLTTGVETELAISNVIDPKYPYWSRTDNTIVFSAKNPGDGPYADFDIWKVSENGGVAVKINSYGTSDIYPMSSFDGDKIAYTNNDGNIYAMEIGEVRVLAKSLGQIRAAYK
jgi:Tol biopolymer transport system component